MTYAICAILCILGNVAAAENTAPYRRHEFEVAPPIGQAGSAFLQSVLAGHEITGDDAHTGTRCERLQFQSSQTSGENERIVIALPQARVISELCCSLWIRTNCSNVRLSLRVRLPRQMDPRTNEPLSMEIPGDLATLKTDWQQLNCRTTEEAMQSRLTRLRSQLSDGLQALRIDDREAYVDQLVLTLQIPQGSSTLELDDLEFGPIVAASNVISEKASTDPGPSRLRIVNDRVRKDGEPFFPIFTLYHGESLDLIARTGVNMLWIRSYEERPLLEALSSMNIGGIASPPQPSAEDAILNTSGIRSIPDWTSPVWAWMLGVRIPASDRTYINNWADQVRDADRQIHRPILADVAEEEREFHRHVDFLASSRFAIHTAVSSPDHFDELRGRRDFALPGKPMFTFLQTEASGPVLDYFSGRQSLPLVEPEQILHQGYEAIAAGFKGVGFWKQIPFDTTTNGLDERIDALRIFCLHCQSLEPFLATGRVKDELSVQVGTKSLPGAKSLTGGIRSPLASRWDRTVGANGQVDSGTGASAEIRATVFESEYGLLILLVWHEPGSQCVPGVQAASSVRVLIRGIGEVAQASEVTPTGVGQSNLDIGRIAGGTEITLREFDQVAAIVIPSSVESRDRLQTVTRAHRHEAAESFVNLARLKLRRVREVHQQLQEVGAPEISVAVLAFRRAESFLVQAEQALQADRAEEARLASQKSLQQLRMVQRAHWEAATDLLVSPTATLEATSFQTLPAHWELMSLLGRRGDFGPNRLPSGSFDSEQALTGAGDPADSWADGSRGNRWTSLRLEHSAVDGRSHLTMVVKPDAPLGQAAVLTSPKIDVKAGDLVIITGQTKIPYPLNGPDHHLAIFETLTGREGALVLKENSDSWRPFKIVRHIAKDGQFRLRFELSGPGVAGLDHVAVHVFPAGETIQQASGP